MSLHKEDKSYLIQSSNRDLKRTDIHKNKGCNCKQRYVPTLLCSQYQSSHCSQKSWLGSLLDSYIMTFFNILYLNLRIGLSGSFHQGDT